MANIMNFQGGVWFFYFLIFGLFSTARAEGSKGLFGSGRGNRSYLESVRADAGFFSSLAQHYVYVQAGETIAVASSAQNIGQGTIRLTSPNGRVLETDKSNVGRIMDKGEGTYMAEQKGPRIGYDAFELYVETSEEGIWGVEFISPLGEYAHADEMAGVPDVRVTDNWEQPQIQYLAAWDISVRDKEDESWVSGRVFSNVLTFTIKSEKISDPESACYMRNYVLTQDGYLYRVDNNGNNGIYFTYFVNNSGFLDNEGYALYKSVDKINKNLPIHDPRAADTHRLVTHKMFYNIPDYRMPKHSYGAVPGKITWLNNKDLNIFIKDVKLVGIEGTENRLSRFGGYINFKTNWQGNGKVAIRYKGKQEEEGFVDREMIVHTVDGVNSVFWDALDGEGKLLGSVKDYPLEIEVSLLGGEIHFPYLDMEINPNGIYITRLEEDNKEVAVSVYWDDSAISLGVPSEMSEPLVNLKGVSSLENGHKWGSYTESRIKGYYMGNDDYGDFSFGNNKGMDTWTYVEDVAEIQLKKVTFAVSDLKVENIVPLQNSFFLGEGVEYEVNIVNSGPSDAEDAVFKNALPEAFKFAHTKVSSSSTGRELRAERIGPEFSAVVSLPKGAHMNYIFYVEAKDKSHAADKGNVRLESSILWANDAYDPDMDGFSQNDLLELRGGWRRFASKLGNSFNNFAINEEVSFSRASVEDSEVALGIKTTKSFVSTVGEQVEYEYVISNVGKHILRDFVLLDMFSGERNDLSNIGELAPGAEFVFKKTYIVTEEDIRRQVVKQSVRINASSTFVGSVSAVDSLSLGVQSLIVEKPITSPPEIVDMPINGLYVPNVFTPNDDGLNDRFVIVGSDSFDSISISIFNRFGKLVYKNSSYKNDWDGKGIQDGTYYIEVTASKAGAKTMKLKKHLLMVRKVNYKLN